MALNIGGGGDFKPFVKYNAKADKWFTKGKDGDVEIGRPTFLADFKNIQTGWFLFKEGMAPLKVFDTSLDNPAIKPGEEYKRGFVLPVYSPKFFNGVAELSSASIHVCNAVKEVYDAYEQGKGSIIGDQVPVIECSGSTAMKDKFGTNYKPILTLKEWVTRPAGFEGGSGAAQGLVTPPRTPALAEAKQHIDDEIPF